MNNLLQIKLPFNNERNKQMVGPRNLRANRSTSIDKIELLISNIRNVIKYYNSVERVVDNYLIDIHYDDIIAKTNRVSELFKQKGKTPNDSVVGARFSKDDKHIITYYVDFQTLQSTVDKLECAKLFIADRLNGNAVPSNFNEPKADIKYGGFSCGKTQLRDIVVDCSVIESISIPGPDFYDIEKDTIVTFYHTEKKIDEIMNLLKVDPFLYEYTRVGDDSVIANPELFSILIENIPYLVSMVSTDISMIEPSDIKGINDFEIPFIPDPSSEPTIGVIDTLFDENVYFSKWVNYIDETDVYDIINPSGPDKTHGTSVTSIIVDGPSFNPLLDDGCGHFKVRHFGVCENRISTSRLMRKIRKIIEGNQDIHVWNLSLGSVDEISRNFISFDSAILDDLQNKYNVVFVISGTNDVFRDGDIKRIGSPADSLNAVVVNSVKRNNTPVSYSRKGPVLSFFRKPDISYYGGDIDEPINVCLPNNRICELYGTSYAAPWISRKLCFLIDVLGLSREVAKALLIDSAAGWTYGSSSNDLKDVIGYGVVPIDINSIIKSERSEIKFTLYGTSISYKTSNYAIPVPKDSDGKFPYIARATLCYFPKCDRSQGVDYTSRELSLKFGRMKPTGTIDDINENVQDEDTSYIDERKSRRDFRKWENTKFISKKIKKKNTALKAYDDLQWGFSVISKERVSKNREELNFGVVITLKEINDANRIDDFIKACQLKGYIVNELDIENKIELYNTVQEEIVFED